MIETASDLATRVQELSHVLAAAAVGIFAVVAFVVGRTLLKVVGVLIVGALLLFGVSNPEWFQQQVEEDLNGGLPAVTATYQGS